jgi:putative ABC transport system permease protein
MHRDSLISAEAVALRAYRGLMFLYPADFRGEYARELCLAFDDRCRSALSAFDVAAIWIHSAFGVLTEAPKEHFHVIIEDLRHALRIMRKDSVVTLTAIAILALGIGSTTIVFSLANGLLVRPLPYSQIDRVIAVQEFNPNQGADSCCEVSFPDYQDLRARTRLLDDVAIYQEYPATVRGEGMSAERVPAANTTDGLFDILGVAPILGRTYTREEDVENGPKVVVIGEDLWRRRYASDPNIIGRVIDIVDTKTQVIGVMPSSFRFPNLALAWLPFQSSVKNSPRTDRGAAGIARLKSAVNIEQADSELQSLMEQINRENPDTSYGNTARALPIRDVLAGSYRLEVITLLGAVGFLLLIACANITNLLLVKASARSREMAIRTALGASRPRLVRQLITESIFLGVIGGAAGLALTYVGLPALLRLIPVDLPTWMNFAVDDRVLIFVTAVSLLTSIFFGIAPAFEVSRVDTSNVLRDSSRGTTPGRGRRILRNALVVGEVALSFILLAGAGLMIRSFLALRHQSLGYDTDHTLTMFMAVPSAGYPQGPKSEALNQFVHDQIASLPGVSTVAFASGIPLETTWGRSLTVEGSPVLALQNAPMINHTKISPGYFRALGIPILEGRDFNEYDYNNPRVAIVDQRLAQNYWPNGSAVGKRIRFGPPEDNEPWHTIVGVVAAVRNQQLTDSPHWDAYIPYPKNTVGDGIVIRTSGDPTQLISAARVRVKAIDPDIALSAVFTMQQILDRASWQERFFAVLFAVFATLALLLVAVGLYGVLAYTVSLRRGELGIRMALGASPARVQAMILKQGLTLVISGLAIGSLIAAMLTHLIASQLYLVKSTDPPTFAFVAVLLSIVAVAACWLPARRAMRVEPIICLRTE